VQGRLRRPLSRATLRCISPFLCSSVVISVPSVISVPGHDDLRPRPRARWSNRTESRGEIGEKIGKPLQAPGIIAALKGIL
jgi:hypothetical protein